MRVLVIPKKAATPKIHWYKFQEELPPAGKPYGWSSATLPRFGSAHRLLRDRKLKSKINVAAAHGDGRRLAKL
jgi:hypothetical protein